MNTFLRLQLLGSVFVAGLTVLFLEIAGARFLAPYYGSSLYVWSSLISVTLLSIAFGAWWGGRLADLRPGMTTMSSLWFGAAVWTGLIPFLRSFAVPLTERMDLRVGVLITAMILYFIPLTILSAVPPLAFKMADPVREKLGSTLGDFSAAGTGGSLVGAIATGFLLVPNFSMTRLFQSFSAILVLFGVLCLWKGGKKAALAMGALLWAAGLFLLGSGVREGLVRFGNQNVILVDQRSSLYGHLKVADMGRFRMLLMDGIMQGGVLWPEGRTLYPYAGYMEALSMASCPGAKKVLAVGLGAGIIPMWFMNRGLDVEAVDINPQMLEMAKMWFGFRSPPVAVHIDDGRRFIQRSESSSYDLVILDVFNGEEIPYHLLTEEAFADVRRLLRPGGAFLINYVSYREKPRTRVTATLVRELRTSFEKVDVFAAGQPDRLNNLIVVALPSAREYAKIPPVETSAEEVTDLSAILADRIDLAEPYPSRLTDDHAPLEWLDRRVRFAWRKEMLDYFGTVMKGI